MIFFLFYSDPNLADNTRQGLNKILADEVPIEIKPVNPPDFYRRVAMEPKKLFWVRARGHIGITSIKYNSCAAISCMILFLFKWITLQFLFS